MNSLRASKLMRAKRMSLYTNNYIWRGGDWPAPSTPMYKTYVHHRRISLEQQFNTLFHEVAPEHIVNLHSLEYPTLTSALWRFGQILIISIPFFVLGVYISKKMGCMIGPTARNTPDQAYRMARLIHFLKQGDFSSAEDCIGRNNGNFYRTLHHEDLQSDSKFFQILRKRGFII